MPLIVTKPLTYNSGQLTGAVATYEVASTITNASNINGYVNTDNSTLGHNIGWETSPTDDEWAHNDTSSPGVGLLTLVISAIGSDTSPTISALNNHPFISEAMHSSHSNSWNTFTPSATGLFDFSNMTITMSGEETISFQNYASSYYSGTPSSSIRSVDTSSSTWYLNGIQVGTQQGSGGSSSSGNEDYETVYWQTSNDPSTSMSTIINNIDINDILMNTEDIPRTDLMFVENVLKNSTGIDDEVKLALSFLLAYVKSNQADTKRLTKNFNKTRAVMNITNLQTLENDYRKG